MRDRNSSVDYADTTSSVRLFSSLVRNSSDEEAVTVGICHSFAQPKLREAAAVVSGEPPDDVAGGEVANLLRVVLICLLFRTGARTELFSSVGRCRPNVRQ